MSARLMVALGGLLALTACSYDFQNSSEVLDRRILAIQADPPELVGGGAIADSVSARALVVDPADPLATAQTSWSACLVPALSNADVGGGNVKRCPDGKDTVQLASGTGPLSSVSVTIPIPPEVQQLLASGSDIPIAQIQVELSVGSDSGDLVAVKQVVVSSVLPDAQEPNRNPVVKGLTLDGVDWLSDSPPTVTYGACPEDKKKQVEAPDKSLVRVCEHEIEPLFDDTESQYYYDRGLSGETELQRERLRFSWFTDAGSWRRGTTTQFDPRDPSPDNVGPKAYWQEPAQKTDRATIWVVVRDGRGGTTWEQREVLFQ